MTTNREKAAEVLHNAYKQVAWAGQQGTWPEEFADALAAAGLLAEDLPKPTWESTHTWIVDDLRIEAMGDFVYLEWSDGMDDMRGMTTRSLHLNKRMVLAILAADHAEKDNA